MLKELRTEQQHRWQEGDRVSIDDYLRRYPELAKDHDALCELILGEMTLREARGETVVLDQYLRRYPQCSNLLVQRYRSELATMLPGEVPAGEMPVGDDTSTQPFLETIQLDVAGQISAQEAAFQQGAPQIPGYKILSELGRGGMGVVYRAKQLSANRDVALKVVRNDVLDTLPLATRQTTLDRFRHEAHAAAQLEHENLVPVYDVGDSGSLRYYAMRYVEGISLYDMIRHKALDNQVAARYIEPVARGLHYAHEQGVLHRDLKPHNIIVEAKSDQPRLTDFGLAKFIDEQGELTRAGEVMGTPSYMSPEQARDSGSVTALADVYSLGASLYHVLTSRPPFQAANIADTLRQVFDEEPVPPRRLNPAIDRDLETICLKCLQKEPARRYESALALAEDLRRYLDHKPILARPAGRVERTWRWCRRNPKLASAIGTAVALAVITVSSIIVSNIQISAANVKISAALKQSDRNLQHALRVADDLLTRVSEEELLKKSGLDPLRRDLLAQAQSHYQKFLAENADNPRIRRELANAHLRVGDIEYELDNRSAAQQSLASAEKLQRMMLKEDPRDPEVRRSLSDTLKVTGEWAKRDEKLPEAIKAFTEAAELRDVLVQEFPDDNELRRLQANIHMNLGIALQAQANDNMNRSYTLQVKEDLEGAGRERESAGRNWEGAVREQQLARRLRAELRQQDAKDVNLLRDQGQGAFNLALLYLGRPPSAPAAEGSEPDGKLAANFLDEAIARFDQVLKLEPNHPQHLYRLLLSYRTRAFLSDEPDAFYAKAEQIAEQLDRENPETIKYRFEHAALLLDYSDFLSHHDRRSAALERLQKLDRLLVPLAEAHDDASEHLAKAHQVWANLLTEPAEADQRRDHLQQSMKYFRLLEKQTGEPAWLAEVERLEQQLEE